MAIGEAPQGGEIPVEQQTQGLLLSGEGVSFLTNEHRDLLRQMASSFAGGRAVEWSVVGEWAAGGLSGEGVVEPVPTTKQDFVEFAKAHHYTRLQGFLGWNTTVFTSLPNPKDLLPKVRFLDADESSLGHVLDLRTVHARLVASDMSPDAWEKAGKGTVSFLGHIVNEKLELDEPLPVRQMRHRDRS